MCGRDGRSSLGLVRRVSWLRLIEEVGYNPRRLLFEHSDLPDALDVFIGVKD